MQLHVFWIWKVQSPIPDPPAMHQRLFCPSAIHQFAAAVLHQVAVAAAAAEVPHQVHHQVVAAAVAFAAAWM